MAVAGASGYIGSHLTAELVARGYPVRALTRNPDSYRGPGDPVRADALQPDSLVPALRSSESAYYLVHSLAAADFAERDAAAAGHFAAAASAAGVRRIVYLGGLGSESGDLSPHLASRRQVESILAAGDVPTTVLRAAVVVGHGSISWEITRQLVEHLPAVVTPRWVHTRTQPIAQADVIRYLVGVLDAPGALGRVFEVGGPDVLSYLDMMRRAAAVMGRRLPNLSVPLLTPRLSAAWLALVTDVDLPTARNLIDSLRTEVVVRDNAIRDVVDGPTIGYEEAVRRALADRESALGRREHSGTRR